MGDGRITTLPAEILAVQRHRLGGVDDRGVQPTSGAFNDCASGDISRGSLGEHASARGNGKRVDRETGHDYDLAARRNGGRRIAMMLTSRVTIIPTYIHFNKLGWIGT